MKKLAFLYLFSVALISGLFGQKTAQLQYAFKDFDGLFISSGYDVYVEKGDNYSITITVSAEHADKVNASVSNGILTLGGGSGMKNIKKLKAYITMPRLSSVTLSSGCDLVGNGVFISEKFRANLSSGCDMNLNIRTGKADITTSSGCDVNMNIEATDLKLQLASGCDAKLTGKAVNATVTTSSGCDVKMNMETSNLSMNLSSGCSAKLTGKAVKASFTTSSGCDIDAKDFPADHVTITVSSGCSVKVHAEKTLSATASNASNITYSGDPVITSNLSGSSTLKKRK